MRHVVSVCIFLLRFYTATAAGSGKCAFSHACHSGSARETAAAPSRHRGRSGSSDRPGRPSGGERDGRCQGPARRAAAASSGHSGWPAHSTDSGERRRVWDVLTRLPTSAPSARVGWSAPPRPRLRLRGDAHQLKRGAGLAAEVFEIEPQDAEERDPAVGVTLELVVPVIAAGEPAVNHAHDTGPPERASTIHSVATVGSSGPMSSRLSAANRCGGSQVVMVESDSMPGPKLQTMEPPSRSSTVVGTNQDEIPGPVAMACQTILRRAGHLDFGLDGTASRSIFLHWHGGSSVSDSCGSGCAMTTRRCAAAWCRLIVVAPDKGRHGLDELVAEGGAIGPGPKPISVSSDSVARRLSAACDRWSRSPTSLTMRAARAIR